MQKSRGYSLENGTLDIFKETQLSKNINQAPSSLAILDSEKEEIKKLFATGSTKENQHSEQNGLFQTYD